MKVLFLCDEYAYGGIETYLESFSLFLKQRKKIQVYCHCWSHHLGKPNYFNKIKRLKYIYTGNILFRSVHNFLNQNISLFIFFFSIKPDVIILNHTKSTFFSLITLLYIKIFSSNTAIYLQYHGSKSLEVGYTLKTLKSSFFQKIKLELLKLADQLTLVLPHKTLFFSTYAMEIVKKHFMVVGTLLVAKPGKPTSFSFLKQEQALAKLGFSKNTKLVLVLTRMEPRKGSLEIKSIFEYISAKNCIALIGSSFEEPIQGSQAFFSSLDPTKISFPVYLSQRPTQEQKELFYNAATCVLLPSTDLETFGFVTLEALSMNKPIFGYDIGATSEILGKYSSTFLVKKNKPKELGQRISKYLSKSSFTSDKNLKSTADLYTWESYFAIINN